MDVATVSRPREREGFRRPTAPRRRSLGRGIGAYRACGPPLWSAETRIPRRKMRCAPSAATLHQGTRSSPPETGGNAATPSDRTWPLGGGLFFHRPAARLVTSPTPPSAILAKPSDVRDASAPL
jgi:hypothetical protein